MALVTSKSPEELARAFNELHKDRARAASFGAVVAQYDRWRAACPSALLDDLAALAPGPSGQVLDAGCGTGTATEALAKRGPSVLGVELDERMAGVARSRGLAVETAAFERWDAGGRRFNAVVCGNAWHWIDPVAGAAKVAEVLRPGGAFVRFWTYDVLDDGVVEALRGVYRELAPTTTIYGNVPRDAPYVDPLESNPAFTAFETRMYRWERTLTAAEWTEVMATVSEYQRLEPERLAALQRGVREAIERLGGSVRSRGETPARLARRA
jgi:SAM-dependent methyltransferase